MFQKVTLIGNLGRDPEMRFTPDGTPVTNINVATNRKWKSSDGTPGEETVWFRIAVWGKQAEAVNTYLSKGRQVYVEGRMKSPNVYTRQDGTPGCSLEVTASVVKFLDSKSIPSSLSHSFSSSHLEQSGSV